MRVESTEETLKHVSTWEPLLNNNNPEDVKTHSVPVVVRHFERADITINHRDPTGFRSPSAYSGSFLSYSPPSVESVWYTDKSMVYGWKVTTNSVAYSFAGIFGNVIGGAADWENSLKQQALRSIKDQKVNLSMMLAFLPQTLKMLRGNFSTISNVLAAAQKADWGTVGKLLKVNPKSTASFYLEVLFGWLQLLRDTQGIAEELHRKCNKPQTRYFYGRARRAQEIPPVVKHSVPYHWDYVGEYWFNGDRKIDHRLVLIYRGEAALLTRMSQLGLTNPLELLWDLVPWSWVVNMGVSIGDFVSTLDATVGLSYLGGSYTQYTRVAGSVSVTQGSRPRQYGWVFNSTPGFYEEMRFNRRTVDDKIDPFVLKNPFSAPIALTAAVIAAAVQRGRKATPQPPRGSTRFVYRGVRTRNLPPIAYRP